MANPPPSPGTADAAIPNVLAERYASPAMRGVWSATGKVVLEREFWIAVLKAQRDLGLDVPDAAIAAYERVRADVDLEAIMRRERTTRHDVKARIDEFCALAGHQKVHQGMTSRDLTENVEQLQVFRALGIVRRKALAALARLGDLAGRHRELVITARTHNVAAQTTTFGKRLAMIGEELLGGFEQLEHLIASFPARGLKGAVGTQLDQLSLFDGDAEKVAALEQRVVAHLGLPRCATNVGQVYPRSLDLRVVAALTELASAPGSFAKTLRLMAGHDLAAEGFADGQVGSSAMPHKMNSRSCERINGFHILLKGYLAMAAGLAGDQWNEGDVSCSVVRRVMLPDAFFAIDGMFETWLTVLGQLEVFPAVIAAENARYLPFLMTTTFLMEAVKAGVGRESAHEAIKEHAVASARALRDGTTTANDLLDRLANDPRLGLDRGTLEGLLARGANECGSALAQTDAFIARIRDLTARNPDAADYRPGTIL